VERIERATLGVRAGGSDAVNGLCWGVPAADLLVALDDEPKDSAIL
jgi:hypothetical protein